LAEFASVVDAVRCAGEIQCAMAGRDLDLAEEQRLRFRIGVNLGDVIADGGDIYGDGVNIAVRLEGLAAPAASASRVRSATISATASLTPSRTWASRASRTSRGRFGSMRCALKA
jgi:class 3 adenylate cyclase